MGGTRLKPADVEPPFGTADFENNSITDAKIASQVSTKITGFPQLTTIFRRSATIGITASTTQTQGQQPLTTDINEISTVANTNDVVTLPSALAASRIIVINNGANTLQIFPASGDDLGDGVNVATGLSGGSAMQLIGLDNTNWEVV